MEYNREKFPLGQEREKQLRIKKEELRMNDDFPPLLSGKSTNL